MDLNNLKLFVTVVQERGFTAASAQTGLTRQTISKRIAELEAEMGSRLLERSTRKVRLTSHGEQLFEYGVQIATLAQQAQQELKSTLVQPRGKLRLAASHLLGNLVLRQLILEYVNQYPLVQVQADFSQDFGNLFENNIDVAFTTGPLEDSSLIAKRLTLVRRRCFASPSYLEELKKQNTPLTSPRDLEHHPCIQYNNFQGDHRSQGRWSFNSLEDSNLSEIVNVNLRVSTNSFWLARDAALSGIGIARLPADLCGQDVAQHKLVEVLSEWDAESANLYAVFPSRKLLGSHIRIFMQFCEMYFKDADQTQPLLLQPPHISAQDPLH